MMVDTLDKYDFDYGWEQHLDATSHLEESCQYRRKAKQVYDAFAGSIWENLSGSSDEEEREYSAMRKHIFDDNDLYGEECACSPVCSFKPILNEMINTLNDLSYDSGWEENVNFNSYSDEPCPFRRRAKQLFVALNDDILNNYGGSSEEKRQFSAKMKTIFTE